MAPMSIRVDGSPHFPVQILLDATATLNLRNTLELPTELTVVVFAVNQYSMADKPTTPMQGDDVSQFPPTDCTLGVKSKLDVKVASSNTSSSPWG